MLKLFCAGLVALALAGCNESRPPAETKADRQIAELSAKKAELCAKLRGNVPTTPEGISAAAAALEMCKP